MSSGFGEALTAALDVMTFAHEIEPSSLAGSQIPRAPGAVVKPIVPCQTTALANVKQQPPPSQQPQHQPQQQQGPATVAPPDPCVKSTVAAKGVVNRRKSSVEWRDTNKICTLESRAEDDPMLELVIASENPDCDSETLLRLANMALVKTDYDPVLSAGAGLLAAANFGLIAEPAKLPPTPKKKQYLLESSDNEVFASKIFAVVKIKC